jgi:16S rRNA (cytosine967-C5)-methyltransferase
MCNSYKSVRVLYKLYNSYMCPQGHTPDPFGRIAAVPWGALRRDLAAAAIERVLNGVPAEREIDRTLRAHRDLSRNERTALVEAIFGVALWRRRLAWQGIHGRGEPERLADRWSLPDWLEAHLERELGDEAEPFCAAIALPGPICLRANRLLTSREELAGRLEFATHPAARARDALLVETEKPNLFGSQAWREGLFEIQDEGSQLVGELVQAEAGETVLDLCAGAGGKSLQLAATGARVLAYDVDKERLARLRTRARRARAADRIEIVAAPAPADTVLVDAPCSELGTLRRGPDARWRIEPAALTRYPPLQAALLETAASNARKRIVYATCTINRKENEEIADAFDEAHPEFGRAATLTLLPHRDGTDGFFAAAWDRR